MSAQIPSIEPAKPADVADIAAVLRSSKLPAEEIAEHLSGFLVARDNTAVVGCVGLERYGDTGILRSLAVVPDFRDNRLGTKLAGAIVRHAADSGIKTLVLLTETAERFFEKKMGFDVVDRGSVDPPSTGVVAVHWSGLSVRDLHEARNPLGWLGLLVHSPIAGSAGTQRFLLGYIRTR